MTVKQVIVIRKDLKMRRGKEIAQGAHASLGAILSIMDIDYSSSTKVKRSLVYYKDSPLSTWIDGKFTKICLTVDSEQELLNLAEKAKEADLIHCLIQDSGQTEFNGVPTYTTLAIGPDESEVIDTLTGHLKLY